MIDRAILDCYLEKCADCGIEPLPLAQLERLMRLMRLLDDGELGEARATLH